jgi:hypothetical protein
MQALLDARVETIPFGEGDVSSAQARRLLGRRVFVLGTVPVPAWEGQLVMPLWPPRAVAAAKRQHRPLKASMLQYVRYPDLYWLYRGLTHGTEKYLSSETGEIQRLQRVEDALMRLNAVLTWTRRENIEDLLDEIELLADQALHELSPHVVVTEKVLARDHIVRIRQGKDSLNRVNPSALLARLVATRRRVQFREENISEVLDIFTARRQAVRLAIAMLEAQIRVNDDFLGRMLQSWRMLIAAKSQFLADQLDATAKVFRTFTIMPFLPTFRYAADEFVHAAIALRQEKFPEARMLLETARSSFRLRMLRADLERTVYAVSRAAHFPSQLVVFTNIVQEIDDAQQDLREIPCDEMRDFSVSSVMTELNQARAFFSVQQPDQYRRALRQGHAALRQVVSRI